MKKHFSKWVLVFCVLLFFFSCEQENENLSNTDVQVDFFSTNMKLSDFEKVLLEEAQKTVPDSTVLKWQENYGVPNFHKSELLVNENNRLMLIPLAIQSKKYNALLTIFKNEKIFLVKLFTNKEVFSNEKHPLFVHYARMQKEIGNPNFQKYKFEVGGKEIATKGSKIDCVAMYITVELDGESYTEFKGWRCSETMMTDWHESHQGGGGGRGGGYSGGYGNGYYGGGGGGSSAPELSPKLKKLFKGKCKLADEDVKKLNEEYEKMREDCFYRTLDNYLKEKGVRLNDIFIDKKLAGMAGVSNKGNLMFNTTEDIQVQNLKHEWIHLSQFQKHNQWNKDIKDIQGMMEWEVALLQDILYFVEIKGKADEVAHHWVAAGEKEDYRTEYIAWLKKMTNNGTSYPDNIDDISFMDFSKIFGATSREYPASSAYIYGTSNYRPYALEVLFRQANENCK